MTSLRSGVKLGLMKKLFLYIFLVLIFCNTSLSDTRLSILNYTTGMSTVVTKVTNKTFIEKMEDKVLKYFKEMKGVKETQDEKPVIAEKEIPCEMKAEDKSILTQVGCAAEVIYLCSDCYNLKYSKEMQKEIEEDYLIPDFLKN